VRLKKYLYVLRPLLALLWVERGKGVAPMKFQDLVDGIVTEPALLADIKRLVQMKRAAMETDYGEPIPAINSFINSHLERLRATAPPKPAAPDFSVLDDLLMETVLRHSPLAPM
jgi:predicted nucleotidyltransferase